MTAFVRETHRVSAAIVRQSAQELASPWQSKRLCWLRRAALGVGVGLGLLGLIGGGVFLWPTVQTQWYPRVVEQVLAVTRHTPQPQPAALSRRRPATGYFLPKQPPVSPSFPATAVSEPASSCGACAGHTRVSATATTT